MKPLELLSWYVLSTCLRKLYLAQSIGICLKPIENSYFQKFVKQSVNLLCAFVYSYMFGLSHPYWKRKLCGICLENNVAKDFIVIKFIYRHIHLQIIL